jgi:hypothetical protein
MKLLIFINVLISFQLNAQNWKLIALLNSPPLSLNTAENNEKIILAGLFTEINDTILSKIALYNGNRLDSLYCGIHNPCGAIEPEISAEGVSVAIEFQDNIYAIGNFSLASGVAVNKLTYFDGENWNAITNDLVRNGVNNGSRKNIKVIDNKLYMCGLFDSINGISASSVAFYDGINWESFDNIHRIDSGTVNVFNDVHMYNGELYAGGNFCNNLQPERRLCRIAKFENEEWVAVGGGIWSGFGVVNQMLIYKDKLIVAGTMSKEAGDPGNNIAAWDGENWDDMGGGLTYTGIGSISDMEVNNDYLYVTGLFDRAGGQPVTGIARWDGINWCRLDSIENYIDFPKEIGFIKDTLFVYGPKNNESHVIRWLTPGQVSNCGNATSIADVEKKNFIIYPNPTNNIFNIQFNELFSGSIEITDISGRLIKSETFKDKTQLTLSLEPHSNGIYFVSVINQNKASKTVRIVKL